MSSRRGAAANVASPNFALAAGLDPATGDYRVESAEAGAKSSSPSPLVIQFPSAIRGVRRRFTDVL
ncbi:hypothetical protein AAE026_31230 [Bradyrhizobium sp. DN5]